MCRELPQSITDLYRGPFLPFNVRYNHENHGGSVVRTLPGDEADEAGTTQYVVL